jgi:hypothetical protein
MGGAAGVDVLQGGHPLGVGPGRGGEDGDAHGAGQGGVLGEGGRGVGQGTGTGLDRAVVGDATIQRAEGSGQGGRTAHAPHVGGPVAGAAHAGEDDRVTAAVSGGGRRGRQRPALAQPQGRRGRLLQGVARGVDEAACAQLVEVQRGGRLRHPRRLALEPGVEPGELEPVEEALVDRHVVPVAHDQLVPAGDGLAGLHGGPRGMAGPGVLKAGEVPEPAGRGEVVPAPHHEGGDTVGHHPLQEGRRVAGRPPLAVVGPLSAGQDVGQ